MDVITQEALGSLRAAIGALVPPAADPALAPIVSVIPVRVTPTGLGGFVGLHHDPEGEVQGRRVAASALVTVRGSDEQALADSLNAVSDAFLAADRAALTAQGIYRLMLDEVGPLTSEGQGANLVASREAVFDVLFEYLRLPQAAGDIINELPVEIDLDEGGGASHLLIETRFEAPESFALFEQEDDPQATQVTPSNWQHSVADQRIEQRSGIRGGGFTATPLKAGAYLTLIPASTHPAVRNLLLRVTLESGDEDGIGCLFRYQDVDNFYFYQMSRRHNYHLLGRKVGGTFEPLDVPGLNSDGGFELNTVYEVKLLVIDQQFRVYVDEEIVVTGQDAAIDSAGRVGFVCHGNDAAFFYRLKLVQFLDD